ncbi:MAG: prepilin-type N-terminal cleavage/methylation domain-containing protein [Calothrix sp. MO_192.B10]|nr:prepilin-type N-terminal cleavage/methylation domain-containing protein [Calothrix sp. MO_192.B10]
MMLNLFKPKAQSNGFTLLEALVAVFMVGIMAAIVAPGWLGFVKRQRLNKAGDLVLAALQEAQREAKKNKRNYSVSLRTNSNIPEIAVYSGSTPSGWSSLGEEVGIQPGQVILGTNLSSTNTAASLTFNSSTTQTITFDYMGVLASKTDGTASDTGLKVVVATPTSGASPSNVKRCVIIETLLGGMRTAKDSGC